jgi:hypothetical protein
MEVNSLSALMQRSDIVSDVKVTNHPRRVDASATTVLFATDSSVKVSAGQSLDLNAPYRDPTQLATRIGGVDMVSPVSVTDYTANTASDGSGTDETSSVAISADFSSGNQAALTITNAAAVDLYVTIQVRGRGIYQYQDTIAEASDDGAADLYQAGDLSLDMPYESDSETGAAVAAYTLALYKPPLMHAAMAGAYCTIGNTTLFERLIRREISDRIGIVEAITGISATTSSGVSVGWFIAAIDVQLDGRGNMQLTWTLAPASRSGVWRLGVAGQSELGLTTTLGYGAFVGHVDVAHGDSAHTDTAHVDTPHGDSHGDGHSDTSHDDTPHTDDAHSDVSHGDSHTDVSHDDVPADTDHIHADVPHADDHDDSAPSDVAHVDVSHGDSAHGDVTHVDAGHGDGHSDAAHVDTAHVDTAHVDIGHVDHSHGDA